VRFEEEKIFDPSISRIEKTFRFECPTQKNS